MDGRETKLSPQDKIARVREHYVAINNRDIEKSLEGFSDDMVFYTPVFPEPMGKDGLRAATQRILDTTDEYRLEPHDILANEDHVVVVLTVHGRRGDRMLKERGVHVIHLNEEGKVQELWAVTDPKPHLALWGDG